MEQIAAQVERRIKAKVGAVLIISLEQKKNIKVAFAKLVANRASPNVVAEAEQRPNSQNPLQFSSHIPPCCRLSFGACR
jgi:hypothetical protein